MSTVLIIGASRGIGWELARQYAEAGERVIATARDDAALARLRGLGVHQALRVDVADAASISGLAWQLDGEKIDTALYVAGVTSHGDATEPPTREAFDTVMHANVLGAMQAIPQVAPLLAPGGRFGFVSSVMGRIATVDNSRAWVYRTSKAALNMAVVSAQSAWPNAIMVCLHPGWVQTDMGGGAAPVTPEASASGLRRVMAALTPADRGAYIQYDEQRFDTW
ncbi:MAG TPA: SDR family oxidoreductase [Ottowia sp.]|nr:SDR family oxidoreductase [Ottowia sp.]